jgi:hypothetical protein
MIPPRRVSLRDCTTIGEARARIGAFLDQVLDDRVRETVTQLVLAVDADGLDPADVDAIITEVHESTAHWRGVVLARLEEQLRAAE